MSSSWLRPAIAAAVGAVGISLIWRFSSRAMVTVSAAASVGFRNVGPTENELKSAGPRPQFKIACVQLTVSSDKSKNLMTATSAIAKAAAMGAKIIVLPEMFNWCVSTDSASTPRLYQSH